MSGESGAAAMFCAKEVHAGQAAIVVLANMLVRRKRLRSIIGVVLRRKNTISILIKRMLS
jgi:hypothetical protein